MNIEALKLFVSAGRLLSFAAVAEEHELDPSSISRSISALEQHLGVRLFNRTTRKISLTEPGEIFFKHVSNVVEEYERAEDLARSVHQSPKGVLKLSSSVAFGEHVIAPLVPKFNTLYPDLKLELLLTDANIDLVSSGVDMAIRLAPTISGDLVVTKLMQTKYKVVANPNYLKSHEAILQPADLQKHECTVFSLPAYKTEWKFRKNKANGPIEESVRIRAGNTVSSAISIMSLVRYGAGPALLADWLVQDHLNDGSLVNILPDYEVTATDFDTFAWIIYPSRAFVPKKVRVMIDFLKKHYAIEA